MKVIPTIPFIFLLFFFFFSEKYRKKDGTKTKQSENTHFRPAGTHFSEMSLTWYGRRLMAPSSCLKIFGSNVFSPHLWFLLACGGLTHHALGAVNRRWLHQPKSIESWRCPGVALVSKWRHCFMGSLVDERGYCLPAQTLWVSFLHLLCLVHHTYIEKKYENHHLCRTGKTY